jgi:hypothetical protein
MDTSRMSQGQMIAAGSAVLLFIFMFLPFWEAGSVSSSLWESSSTFDIYLLITVLVAIAAALTAAGGHVLPGMTLNGATALLGGVGTVLMLWLLIFDWPDGFSRQIGAFLVLIAVAGIAFGGWSAAQEDTGVDRY